ncbi:hypothetical protein D9M69_733800 [compost metagenome]
MAADGGVHLAAGQPVSDLVHLQWQHLHLRQRRLTIQSRENERQETQFAQVRQGNAETPFGGDRVEIMNALHRALDAGQRLAQGAV